MKKGVKVLLTLLCAVQTCWSATDSNSLLEAQFLNVNDEIKASQSTVSSEDVHEADQKVWYEVGMDFDEEIIKKEWIRIHSATLLVPDKLEHNFVSVDLSFPFPLFGGFVRNLTVTTAGALITGNSEDKLRLPSHVAPFLTSIPLNENDKTVFYDTGSFFLAQWEKHVDGDDHHILKFRVKLFPDGSIRFMYKNFLTATKEAVQKTGYPAILGVQDGFSTPKTDSQKGSDVYLYPSVLISMDQLLDKEWAMITLVPVAGCSSRSNENCTNDCTRCQQNDCVYNMELHRPTSVCYSGDNCRKACTMDYKPVCGSDKITYSNLCQLQHAACAQKKSIDVTIQGTCGSEPSSEPNPSVDYCKVKCPNMVAPVCGTDSQTYKNKCILFQQNCLNNQTVQIKAETGCGLVNYDYTEIKTSKGDDDEYSDDEVTSDKTVKTEEKKKNPDTAINNTNTNTSNNNNSSNPDCTAVCDPNARPTVCLNGKIVFNNICMLKQVACQQGYKVTNVTEGFCATDKNATNKTVTDSEDCDVIKGCPVTNEPVCGSNNITYQNECSLKQINCQQKLGITIVKKGNCFDDVKDDKNVNNCNSVCTREMNPVCGSDGQMYNNNCLLKLAICQSNNTISMVDKEQCNTTAKFLGGFVNFPVSMIPSEKEQFEEESKLADGEEDSESSSSTKVMGVVGLVVFFALVALTVLYRRRSRRNLLRSSQVNPASTRASTDSWLYPEAHEFRDEEAPPASGEITTSRNWELGDFQRNREPKNDKLQLVPNIELETQRDVL